MDAIKWALKKLSTKKQLAVCLFGLIVYLTLTGEQPAWAMHIAEGFLPLPWCIFWAAVTFPFLLVGLRAVNRHLRAGVNSRLLLGLATAYVFVLSALKLPSVTGSCSHPTGIGLGAILLGPMAVIPVGTAVLLFQALLLAHGGLTTLGANIFSMAVVGGVVAYAFYRGGQVLRLPERVNVFLAAFSGDISTYVLTSLQLALAFPDPVGGITASFAKFAAVFAVTQLPLAVGEGLITAVAINALRSLSDESKRVLTGGGGKV